MAWFESQRHRRCCVYDINPAYRRFTRDTLRDMARAAGGRRMGFAIVHTHAHACRVANRRALAYRAHLAAHCTYRACHRFLPSAARRAYTRLAHSSPYTLPAYDTLFCAHLLPNTYPSTALHTHLHAAPPAWHARRTTTARIRTPSVPLSPTTYHLPTYLLTWTATRDTYIYTMPPGCGLPHPHPATFLHTTWPYTARPRRML